MLKSGNDRVSAKLTRHLMMNNQAFELKMSKRNDVQARERARWNSS